MLATGTLVAALSPTLAEAAAKAAETGRVQIPPLRTLVVERR